MTLPNGRNAPEVADIFREYGPAYRAHHHVPLEHRKVRNAREKCRTHALGGHLQACDHCGAAVPAYHACRNRFCPKCHWLVPEKWLTARKKEWLPVSSFPVVLTLPDVLHPLIRSNERVLYAMLFQAGSETLLPLERAPKQLGADIGFMAMLHTWGNHRSDHPHRHGVVPGGGLSDDEREWRWPNKAKKKKKCFVHVNRISTLFKKKCLHYLDRAYQQGERKLEGPMAYLQEPAEFDKLTNELYSKKWVT